MKIEATEINSEWCVGFGPYRFKPKEPTTRLIISKVPRPCHSDWYSVRKFLKNIKLFSLFTSTPEIASIGTHPSNKLCPWFRNTTLKKIRFQWGDEGSLGIVIVHPNQWLDFSIVGSLPWGRKRFLLRSNLEMFQLKKPKTKNAKPFLLASKIFFAEQTKNTHHYKWSSSRFIHQRCPN